MKRVLMVLALGVFCIYAGCTRKQVSNERQLFNGKDFIGWTLFLPGDSVDVKDVWSVKDGVIHCQGVPNGYMRTVETFAHYQLHLEWRWVEKPTNSGVLLHCQSPDRVWPNCIECQLWSGNAGDLVLIGPGRITVDDSVYVNNEQFLIIKKNLDSNEKPAGEWNAYDIEVRGDAISCSVNGVLQNSGTAAALSSGHIGLQSEGSPIEFRNILLTPLP